MSTEDWQMGVYCFNGKTGQWKFCLAYSDKESQKTIILMKDSIKKEMAGLRDRETLI